MHQCVRILWLGVHSWVCVGEGAHRVTHRAGVGCPDPGGARREASPARSPPAEPDASWSTAIETPWWKDKAYVLGSLTKKTRKVKLLNMLSRQETTIEVCSEETLNEIQRRYLGYNAHAQSYTWKRTDSKAVGRVLDMRKTLEENGIADDMPSFDKLNIDEDFYIPVLHLYFSDDLTIA